ncbi:metal-dependent transcriptional regulator [bacterium]|nr:metal-dependent transcriptional regulator [bacterium]
MSGKLTSNMEDYLETIFMLEVEKGNVRVKDISRKMGITMPSVSGALKKLREQGMVQHRKYEVIVLTPEGARTAEKIYRRHQVIREFLNTVLGVSTSLAERDACNMEHVISPETIAGFSRMLDLWKNHDFTLPDTDGGGHDA